MKGKNVLTITILLLLIILSSSLLLAETSIKEASTYKSNGDLINGWNWLRDSALNDYAEWTFHNITAGTTDLVLDITALATDKVNGGRGFDAKFKLIYGFPGSGNMGGVFKTKTVTIPNVSSSADPLGYNCKGQVYIDRDFIPGAAAIFIRIERESPQDNHIAFKQDSIVIMGEREEEKIEEEIEDQEELGGVEREEELRKEGKEEKIDIGEAIVPIQEGDYTGFLGDAFGDGKIHNNDNYQIYVEKGQLITLQLIIPGNASYNLTLFNPNRSSRGSSITQLDTKTLDYVANSTGTWYVKVSRSSGEGKYQLDIDTHEAYHDDNEEENTETSCTFTLSSYNSTFRSAGGYWRIYYNSLIFPLQWSALSDVSWIQIHSGSSGPGSQTLSFSVQENSSTTGRTGHISVENRIHVVNQQPKIILSLSNGGRVLSSNIPIFVSETEKGSDIDSDADGILQEWEDEAMEYINPYIELDEEEDWLTKRDTDHVANYVRIHPSNSTGRSTISYHSENLPQYIIFRYVVTWSQDYGRFGVTAHKGDHERIFMAWKVIDNKNLRLEWVFTSSHEDPSAHHGVWNAWHRVCNKGDVALNFTQKMYSEVMCSNLEFYNNRLLVYASEGKHAIYPSCDLCENVNLFIGVAGEDCGGGGTFRFDCYNVGEPPEFIDSAIYDLSLDRGKLEKELPEIDFKGFADKLSSRYRIQIKTGNEDLSGTDAKISIKLFGSEGTSSWYDVYSKPSPPLDITIRHLGTFEKGDTDNIYVNSSDLGEINKIQIKHDNTGPGPGWLISEILVEDLMTHATWHARPNTWLDKFPWQDNTNKTFNLSSTP